MGSAICRWAGLDPSREPALAATLGWGAVGQLLFLLGLVGQLRPAPVFAGLSAVALVAWLRTARATAAIRPTALFASAIFAPVIWLALYPPTGFDATLYHLLYAQAFAESGRLEFLPTLRFPIFPQLAELLFVPGFLLGSDIGAKLTQAWASMLTAALLFRWAEARRPEDGEALPWAPALWLGTPLVIWIGSQAYVDAGLTLFVTAALYSWERAREQTDKGWWIAASLALGFACAVKYLGLFFVATLGLWALPRVWSRRASVSWRDSLRPIAWLAIFLLAVAAPWYLRIHWTTGSPLFPFYEPIFGTNEWSSFHDRLALQEASQDEKDGFGMAGRQLERMVEGLSFLAATPWRSWTDRETFNRQAPLSPFLLALLPWSLIAFRRHRSQIGATGPWMGLLIAYGLFWLTTVRDLRFLMPVLPLLSLLLAESLPLTRPTKRHARLVTLALLAPGLLYGVFKISRLGPLPLTPEARHEYLAERRPGYDTLRRLNEQHGGSYVVYGLFAENLRYYSEGTFLGDWAGPESYDRLIPLLRSCEPLAAELRDMQVDYLLVRPTAPYSADTAELADCLLPIREDRGLTLFRVEPSRVEPEPRADPAPPPPELP